MGLGHIQLSDETIFQPPDAGRQYEMYSEPSAIHRHYMVLRDAMKASDHRTIGNRQLRLLNGGFEIPITLKQVNRLLEKYTHDS